jgi:hypothetical protein
MIDVKIIGRLGNNMFQYGIGRILAENKNYSMNLIPIGNNNLNLLYNLFPNTRENIIGNIITKDEKIF